MGELKPPIDREKFLEQFQGMEDLAQHAVDSFLEHIPKLMKSIEDSIQNKSPQQLELAAHTLKGAVSNFYAEPSRILAWKLEQLGHGTITAESKSIFNELQIEIERLTEVLTEYSSEKVKS